MFLVGLTNSTKCGQNIRILGLICQRYSSSSTTPTSSKNNPSSPLQRLALNLAKLVIGYDRPTSVAIRSSQILYPACAEVYEKNLDFFQNGISPY